MSRWLDVLKQAHDQGFEPPVAKIGYGDPTSTSIISQAVQQFGVTGAIRHGAESFNFYFPQVSK